MITLEQAQQGTLKDRFDYMTQQLHTMNTPQAVTDRYLTNLLRSGQNADFTINCVLKESIVDDGIDIGVIYRASVNRYPSGEEHKAAGNSIAHAVRRALEKHGVTFR